MNQNAFAKTIAVVFSAAVLLLGSCLQYLYLNNEGICMVLRPTTSPGNQQLSDGFIIRVVHFHYLIILLPCNVSLHLFFKV